MIAKPARKVWYELGNRNGEVFAEADIVYYRRAYHNDYETVVYEGGGTIPVGLIPNIPMEIGWKFDMPPMQGAKEKVTEMPSYGEPPPEAEGIDYPLFNEYSPLDRLWKMLLSVIDWLNGITGAEKQNSKSKSTTERMKTLGELFEGYETVPEAPEPQPTLTTLQSGVGLTPAQQIIVGQIIEETISPPRPGKPPGNTSTARK